MPPLYNIIMMFYMGVVTTSANQNITVICYLVFSMPFCDVTLDRDVLGRLHLPCDQNQNVTKNDVIITVT